jgi:hypothetical protein
MGVQLAAAEKLFPSCCNSCSTLTAHQQLQRFPNLQLDSRIGVS